MTDSLRAAADLADKLGRGVDEVLPQTEPVIDCDTVAAERVELRQVAGISAGGSLELRPGSYDFGPVQLGSGHLDDGEPDSVGFTLSLDRDLAATVGPGDAPVLLDAEPVVSPTDLAGRVINAGSARFVVARPRPPQRRAGPPREIRLDAVDPWVWDPIPKPLEVGRGAYALVGQRRRLHYGPDEIGHRIRGGRGLLWDRDPQHPLFGTAVVAMTDIPLHGVGLEVAAAVPVSIDFFASSSMVIGERRLQLAVVRHILLAMAAASHPNDLRIGLISDRGDLDFVNRLPHAQDRLQSSELGMDQARTLLVVDRSENHGPWVLPGFDAERTSVLALTSHLDVITPGATVLAMVDESTMAISSSCGAPTIEGATPVGFAHPMAVELAEKLSKLPGVDPVDG